MMLLPPLAQNTRTKFKVDQIFFKDFPGHGLLKATITKYEDRLYHVEYEDVDEEDLDAGEITFSIDNYSV